MNNSSRFDGRGKNYDKFRPEYPERMFLKISKEVNLKLGHIIVDVGAGTGKSSHWFLKEGYSVLGIEPNTDMIKRAMNLKNYYPNFNLKQNEAEHTGLQENSVDLLISGQAIQYFNIQQVRDEFCRILKRNGWIAIFWYNETSETQFEKDYYQLIHKYRINNNDMDIRITRPQRIKELFGSNSYHEYSFKHSQVLDKKGILGRTLSSSHVPKENTKECEQMISNLDVLLENKREFTLNYVTSLYLGKLSKM